MKSVQNIAQLISTSTNENLTKDQIVRKKLESIGVKGETLFSESFKLSTPDLIEEELKECFKNFPFYR